MTGVKPPAWELIYELHDQGLSQSQIAERVGVSNVTVSYHLRTRGRPKQQKTRSDAGTGAPPPACVDCGVAVRRVATRCRLCADEQSRRRAAASRDNRIDRLRAWAVAARRVPSTKEASAILGLGRSQSAALLLAAFGPDKRDGYHRRTVERPWPERAD